MNTTEAIKSFECEKVLTFVSRFWKLKKESYNGFGANG